jgi:CRISPR-associated protein Cas1
VKVRTKNALFFTSCFRPPTSYLIFMPRHYYLTRAGRLRRKDNTLCFEPTADAAADEKSELAEDGDGDESNEISTFDDAAGTNGIGIRDGADVGMGDLSFDAPASNSPTLAETLSNDSSTTSPQVETIKTDMEASEDASDGPVRVREARIIPVEDVDALWIFSEMDLNARVLIFLAQRRIPVHFFNYYGFYAGTFYPREYLQAGYLVVKQVRHYSNRRLRVRIAREFIAAALYNILRNVRYYATRGVCLQAETEAIQAEILRLETVTRIDELMSCEGRARASYYQAFARILRNDVDFTKRVRRPPDNIVNALISFTNGLVYSATLTQIYRTQLDPTVSFLHEPGARRFSLALDLAEVFKPILADRLLFRLFNNRQLNERDFAQDLNCCYLKERGRKKVLQAWDARLQTTIEHRRLKRKISYERLIRLECYKLIKHLTNVEPYTGFRAWW